MGSVPTIRADAPLFHLKFRADLTQFTTISDSYLRFTRGASFVVVAAMGLILLGALLLSLYLISIAPMAVRLPFLHGMCIAVIIGIYTLFSQLRSRNQPNPKNASPSDFDSFQKPRG